MDSEAAVEVVLKLGPPLAVVTDMHEILHAEFALGCLGIPIFFYRTLHGFPSTLMHVWFFSDFFPFRSEAMDLLA